MQVTSPNGWLALYTIGALLACVLLWSIIGSVPTRVDGEGMLIRGGMLREIRASGPGEVKTLSLRINEVVKAGQQVGELVRPDYREEVRSVTGKYHQATREASTGEAEDRTTVTGLNADMQSAHERDSHLHRAAAEGPGRPPHQEDGVRKGPHHPQPRDGRRARRRVAPGHGSSRCTRRSAATARRFARWSSASGRATSRRRPSASTSTGSRTPAQFASGLRSPVDGRVVEIKKRPGDSVTAGEVVAVIEPESAELEPVVYVTSTTGKQIRAGMDAQVSPSTVKREEYGFMTARVTSVGEYPVTPEAVRAAVANNALADEFIGTTAKIEIRARLAPDAATPSGYKWSSSTGPGFRIQSGTRVTVSVVVDRRAPITLVLPTLRRTVGL